MSGDELIHIEIGALDLDALTELRARGPRADGLAPSGRGRLPGKGAR
jgi:hypothetical protein